jgi:UDP-glucose-4-epimerase GalE
VLALARAGHDVFVYDDLSAGHAEAVSRAGRAAGRTIPLIRGDIGDRGAVRDALAQSRATAVLHFAARLLVGESVADPFGYYRTNVTGTLALLETAVAAGVRHLVFSSTCATFGEPVRSPMDETHPQQPINPYGQTKLAIEHALPHLERAFGLRWAALRYFNASGADPDGHLGEDHDPEEHLIPRAIAAARGGEPLTVFGDDYPTPDGTCIRDFVHVSDLADAHVAALARLEAGAASGAYNLGNGDGMSVRQVLETVGHAAGRPVPHCVGPRRPGDPARLVASSDRARRDLGWTPRLAKLDRIVETALGWHDRHPQGYGPDGDGKA